MFHYGQWNTERYLSGQGRMKFLQYGTGCAGECSEVTKSTVPYLLSQKYTTHFNTVYVVGKFKHLLTMCLAKVRNRHTGQVQGN